MHHQREAGLGGSRIPLRIVRADSPRFARICARSRQRPRPVDDPDRRGILCKGDVAVFGIVIIIL